MRTSQGKGEGLMNVADYDKALYYTHRSQWDNLLILMVRTQDDLLSKRIEHFLHAYQFNRNDADVEKCLYGLLQYIDHASEAAASEVYSQPMYT
jgi:hypothetical protein